MYIYNHIILSNDLIWSNACLSCQYQATWTQHFGARVLICWVDAPPTWANPCRGSARETLKQPSATVTSSRSIAFEIDRRISGWKTCLFFTILYTFWLSNVYICWFIAGKFVELNGGFSTIFFWLPKGNAAGTTLPTCSDNEWNATFRVRKDKYDSTAHYSKSQWLI